MLRIVSPVEWWNRVYKYIIIKVEFNAIVYANLPPGRIFEANIE